MILELGIMKHLGMELYKVYITHGPWMTLTYLTARSTYVAHAFECGNIGKCHLMVMIIFKPRGLSVPVYDQNI